MNVKNGIEEIAKKVNETVQPILEPQTRMAELGGKISEAMGPFLESQTRMAELGKKISEAMGPILESQTRMAELGKKISEAMGPFLVLQTHMAEYAKPFTAVSILAKNQFVIWEYIDKVFIDKLLNSDDINACILERCSVNNFERVDYTIKDCRSSKQMKPYKALFSQAISAYRKKHFALSVLGLLVLADGLLTDISGDATTSFYKRAKNIMEKAERNEDVIPDEYAILSLAFTFHETLEMLSSSSDFNRDEPASLNRHWIMHGRYRKTITQLDSIKLLNFLYGIILIDKFGRM